MGSTMRKTGSHSGKRVHKADEEDWFGVDVEQLSARLRFHPDDAHIWLEGERMILLHVTAFSSLRRELVEILGIDHAREVLQRMGHVSGTLDAAMARRAMPHAGPVESFKAGPRLHAIEGIVMPEQARLEVDPETGFHLGEWIWRNSAEADAHIAAFGLSAEPICWTAVGYASAYSSAFMGHPVIYREVECRGMGAPHCRIVGKSAALWDEGQDSGTQISINLEDFSSSSDFLQRGVSGQLITATEDHTGRDALIGESSSFFTLMTLARRIASTDAPVLILGEPGAGKKSLGKSIHMLSNRAGKPLMILNCARHDDADLELDLFGHERTSSQPARIGKLERINGGTLLLEDVHTLSPRTQAKFLQLVVEGQVERQGATQPRPLNVRIIACANDSLAEAVRSGRFRQDLYYRLSICPVVVPPLRERRADLPLLIRHFLERYAARYGKPLKGMTMDAVSYLLTHEFHGNVAELEAMLERAVIMAQPNGSIGTAHLLSAADLHRPSFFRLSEAGALVSPGPLPAAQDLQHQSERLLRGDFNLETFEADLIKRAVSQSGGNLAQAARLLGLTRPQLAYRYSRLHEPEE